nr:hypothetical protein [Tanacetum cinerariifolium]
MTSFGYHLNLLYPVKECLSCGALYTTDYCCSNGSLVDKIICDLNKAPDSAHLYIFLSNQCHCFHCKDVLGDGEFCQRCTCMRCGSGLSKGLCLICKHNQNSLNDSPSISENSSQSPLHINHHCCYECGDPLKGIFCRQFTCKLCGNGAHYGYNCPPKVPIIPNPKPFNNQTIKELPPTFPSFDSKSDLVHEFLTHLRNFLLFLVNSAGTMLVMVTIVHLNFRLSIRNRVTIKTLISRQNFKSFMIFNNKIFVVKIAGLLMKLTNLMEQLTSTCDMVSQFIQKKEEEKQIEEDQAANAQYWKIIACYDDDDNDYAFAITPNEPVHSLSMGDEHLDTIPTTESEKFTKSSVENLVPIPSESEGESECDVHAREEFTTFSNILFNLDYEFDSSDDQSLYDEDVPDKIFSNPLFEEEIISMKIDQHHHNAESDLIKSLRTHDSSIIISSKIDSLFDEFAGELALLKSIPSGIDETDCDFEEEIHLIKKLLYDISSSRPPEEFVSDNSDAEIESFSPSLISVEDIDSLMEEIDLSFTLNYPTLPSIEDDDYDSERDILIFEYLPSKDTLSLLKKSHSILIFLRSLEKSPDFSSHQGLKTFQLSAKCPMMIHGKNNPILDVHLFHFYPP